MFRNVMVGVDGREGGRDALALARRLLAPGGRLTLAHIYLGEDRPWRGSSPIFDAAERDRAQELLERVRTESGVEAELRWHGCPSPGRGLHELAEAEDSDLLVIGSPGHSLLHRVLVGEHMSDALGGAPCAIAIAPAGYTEREGPLRTIGVGYDGSPESAHALELARGVAAATGAHLSAFQVVTIPTYLAGGRSAPDGEPVSNVVAQAREEIAELGGVEAHAGYGDAAEELALYGGGLDLLVVGSRGYGPFGRLVHGSTTRRLIRSARCPLLVLVRGARGDEESPATPAASLAGSVPGR